MDKLAVSFATTQALNAVESCDDLEELKRLTKVLIKGHFASRMFIEQMMRGQLEALAAERQAQRACDERP
jgi:hypothetical protein